MKSLKDININIKKLEDVIALCTFGSYNEGCWDKNRSDIDVMVLLTKELTWEVEIELEDYLTDLCSNYFNHDNIHITFISGFIYPFGEIMIASPNKFIIDSEKYLDYVLGYSAFKRDREYLEIIRDYHLQEMEAYHNGLL